MIVVKIGIAVFALMLIGASFWIGYFMGATNACDMIGVEPEEEDSRRLHCFECEIDMPVKEKNGEFFCSNCGLYHGTKI
jgi:hypothetical protein